MRGTWRRAMCMVACMWMVACMCMAHEPWRARMQAFIARATPVLASSAPQESPSLSTFLALILAFSLSLSLSRVMAQTNN